MASAFREEAASLRLRITGSAEKRLRVSSGDLAYAAVEQSEQPRIVSPIFRIMGTDALLMPSVPRLLNSGRQPHQFLLTSAAEDPSQLPREGQRFLHDFRDRYHREPGRYAAYGYEAMAVVLDSIRRAGDSGDDRDSVVNAFFDTTDRRSVLGTYSIDDVGNTTLDRLAGYRVVNGKPRFETALSVNQ
jgi:branched-chain amino acid transport system substrate-binding protein